MIPGGLYLADTSAIARVADPAVRRELTRLGRQGLLATCVTVDLEVLHSARTPGDYARTSARRAAGFVDLPLSAAVGVRARAVQAMLAARSQHGAGIVDLLTAAVAEHHQAIVLHYDSDFDHIAAVTGQDTRWVTPRGSAG